MLSRRMASSPRISSAFGELLSSLMSSPTRTAFASSFPISSRASLPVFILFVKLLSSLSAERILSSIAPTRVSACTIRLSTEAFKKSAIFHVAIAVPTIAETTAIARTKPANVPGLSLSLRRRTNSFCHSPIALPWSHVAVIVELVSTRRDVVGDCLGDLDLPS